MEDLYLIYIITLLLLSVGVLRILLARKRKEAFTLWRKIQRFVFPALLLVSALLWQFCGKDYIIAAVFLGLGQELLVYLLFGHRKPDNATADNH